MPHRGSQLLNIAVLVLLIAAVPGVSGASTRSCNLESARADASGRGTRIKAHPGRRHAGVGTGAGTGWACPGYAGATGAVLPLSPNRTKAPDTRTHP